MQLGKERNMEDESEVSKLGIGVGCGDINWKKESSWSNTFAKIPFENPGLKPLNSVNAKTWITAISAPTLLGDLVLSLPQTKKIK